MRAFLPLFLTLALFQCLNASPVKSKDAKPSSSHNNTDGGLLQKNMQYLRVQKRAWWKYRCEEVGFDGKKESGNALVKIQKLKRSKSGFYAITAVSGSAYVLLLNLLKGDWKVTENGLFISGGKEWKQRISSPLYGRSEWNDIGENGATNYEQNLFQESPKSKKIPSKISSLVSKGTTVIERLPRINEPLLGLISETRTDYNYGEGVGLVLVGRQVNTLRGGIRRRLTQACYLQAFGPSPKKKNK